MKTFTTNIFGKWTHFFGAVVIIAFMAASVAVSQPAAPVLATPANVAANQPQAPTLIWNASTGADSYQLQVSTSNDFSSTLYDNSSLTGTSQLITGLTVNTTYYWHVRATGSGGFAGTSAFSSTFSFTTWATIPSPGPLPVTLGKTAMFAILSYAGITDVPASAVTGSIGASPIAGSGIHLTQTEVTGTIYTVDATGPAGSVVSPSLLTTAMGDLTIAYNDAAGRTVNPIGLAGNLGGQTLYPGLYKSSGSLEISSGDLTLDANGDATSVWIFQIASSFNMTSGRQVFLTNGAKASNVFWQVGSAATFGTTCVMKGTIMAATTVTMATGATLEGRALAKTADVTLQQNTIVNPGTINLKSSGTFRVLAGAGIGVTGTATVKGNVGTSTGTIGSGITATGFTIYDPAVPADQVIVSTAHTDLLAAYNDAAGRTADNTLSATSFELGGTTRTPGVYKIGTSAAITGALTLDGAGIYIFQIGTTLTTAASSSISLINGALWSDIFWQVGGTSVTLGAGSTFEGAILANTSIGSGNGVTMNGRLLAGAVTSSGTVSLNSTSVLPVELVSFTASSTQKNANLHWTTATEVNNYGFEIERTIDNGKLTIDNWNTVGFVEGNGTTNAPKNYSYSDNNLTSGTYSYRLKQIDRDGAFEYSNSVEVTIVPVAKEYALLQNYPNPFNPTTMISYTIPANSSVSLKVFDALGREVAMLVNEVQAAGTYTAPFNASRLSSGVYVYRLEARQHNDGRTGSFVSIKKLILMK